VPLFRRKAATDPVIEAFGLVAERIDAAQRSLLAAIPTARDPGIPLAEALAAFEMQLTETEGLMPAWRGAQTAEAHDRCTQALRSARAEAQRLRLEAGTLGFEALNARVGDVLHSLDEFADAERALRRGKGARPSP
jgi:hypothetical protein